VRPGQRCQHCRVAPAGGSFSPPAGHKVRLRSGTVAGRYGTLCGSSSSVPCQARSWYNA
jgi:hypothetical protein